MNLSPSQREAQDFVESFRRPSQPSMRVHSGEKKCFKCGSKDKQNLTKHHYSDNGKGPWDWMCRTPCHDLEHEMLPKEIRKMQNPEEYQRKRAERIARRAQLRIKRDLKFVQNFPVRIIQPNSWLHIADQWTPDERRSMLRYLEELLLKEKNKEFEKKPA